MRRILLDTSAYSAFMRNHLGVVDRVQTATTIVVTPVVLGELHAGFLKGTLSQENRHLLEEFLASTRVELVVLDEETSLRYAEILRELRRMGTPIPTNDIWIAASAKQHGLYVLTTDAHFEHISQVSSIVLSP